MLVKVSYFIFICSAISTAFDIEILGTNKDEVDIDLTKIIYDDYLKEFDKNYITDEEYQNRFNIFMDRLMIINKKNIEVGSKMFGLTPFTDMTTEEFKNHLCNFDDKIDDSLKLNYTTLAKKYGLGNGAPDSWDWVAQGAVTAVKFQQTCSSCWAFSATGTIEGQYYLKNKQLMEFSEQELLDCIPNRSCGLPGYNPISAFNDIVTIGGLVTEQVYPYENQVAQCRLDKSKIVVKVQSGHQANADENQLMELLHTYGPISIALSISQSFHDYKSGIFDESCTPSLGGHAVLLVGYGTDNGKPYWKVKNSWDSGWGEAGYIRMARGKNICGITHQLGQVTIV